MTCSRMNARTIGRAHTGALKLLYYDNSVINMLPDSDQLANM